MGGGLEREDVPAFDGEDWSTDAFTLIVRKRRRPHLRQSGVVLVVAASVLALTLVLIEYLGHLAHLLRVTLHG